jgi:hypothetical protein
MWSKIHEVVALSPTYRSNLTAGDQRRRQEAAALVARVLKSGANFAAGSPAQLPADGLFRRPARAAS